MRTSGGRIAAISIGIATAIVIVAIALLPFLTPAWIAFEQDRSDAQAWTGFATEDLRTATNAILHDLVLGPPAFDVEIGGSPVLEERERAHMRDVRTVFAGFYLLALAAAAGLVLASRRQHRAATWRAVRGGALGLTVGVIVVGGIALVAFDQLFELFHEIFFPAGSYLFDPATDRMVQLFPFQLFQESAIVVGVVIIALALGTAWFAGRRAVRLEDTGTPVPDMAPVAEPGA